MIRRMSIPLLAAFAFAALAACVPDAPLSAANNPSSAFFDVPPALVGDLAARSARTATSDAWVASAVESYYEYVRGQVRFGAELAAGVRNLIGDLESVAWGDGFLLDQDVALIEGSNAEAKFRWKTLATGSWSLEWWKLDDTKILELAFTRDGGRYAGEVLVNGVTFAEGLAAGLDAPDMVRVAFDSDSDGAGTSTLYVEVEDFRAHPDLDDGIVGGEEDLVISLSKDPSGTVSIGSIARVTNSRHFVWNGYDYAGALDTGSTAETRYYVAAGAGTLSGLATVHLGIPVTVAADAFTGYGVGDLVAQLLTDRLNNDYQFDADTTGWEVVTTLNTFADPQLATGATVADYTNTVAEVRDALLDTQAGLVALSQPPENIVDYLVDMTAIENPAYFDASGYTGYGAAPGSGYPDLGDAAAFALVPAVAEVEALATGEEIVFATTGDPGF